MKTGPTQRYRVKRPLVRAKIKEDVFEGTIQKSHIWLNDLMSELNWNDRPHRGYLALRAVLHALRDRLTVEEAVQLGAQLPMLIRGLYYEGWTLKGKPHKERHEKDFLDHVTKAFKGAAVIDPREVVRGVFSVLVRHTSAGEIEDVKNAMPKPLRDLWP
ncbi:MAG: DUF2267 domain-containing protein [Alphaproteobacteria bacterium]